jgi:hypothetical protein
MKPSPFHLFAMYHLGLTPDFQARFHNINAVARHFAVSPDDVNGWLEEYRLTPEVFTRISFNLAQAHSEAQDRAMFTSARSAEQYARQAFARFLEKLPELSQDRTYEDVDYNDIWGDGPDR